MKLRNLLLASALLLAVGSVSAFAGDPITNDENNDPVFQRESSKGYWETSGNNTLSIVVIEHAPGWNYELIGHNTVTGNWEELGSLNSGKSLSKTEKSQYSQMYKDFGGNGNSINGAKVYELTSTFDETNIDKIGVLGHNGSFEINHTVISALNDPAVNGSIFTFLSQYDDAVAFNSNHNLKGIVVIKSAYYVGGGSGGNGGEGVGNQGAPLPAPITTLLIALGFGAALVMYRNRKQAAV